MVTQSFVTISVDDGHPTDLHTQDLLEKYGLKATFYIPAANRERPVMSRSEIQQLGKRFEIGGHTMNHVPLKSLSPERARAEINDGKKWLEDLLGVPVPSFAIRGESLTREPPPWSRKRVFWERGRASLT